MGAGVIELVRAVRGLADEDHAVIADPVEDLSNTPRAGEYGGLVADDGGGVVVTHGVSRTGCRAASSSRLTSASLVSEKSRYHCPTALKSLGTRAQITRSAICSSRRHASSEPTGTATTTDDGPRLRTACTATRIVEPVASPSSTRIATRPRTESGSKPCR